MLYFLVKKNYELKNFLLYERQIKINVLYENR